jgi:hypothetical protein
MALMPCIDDSDEDIQGNNWERMTILRNPGGGKSKTPTPKMINHKVYVCVKFDVSKVKPFIHSLIE